MKMFTLAAAGLAMLAGLAPVAPAAAAPQRHVEERTVVTHRTVVRRDDDRRYRPRWRTRQVCRTERHHGRRERVCRTVRYRR